MPLTPGHAVVADTSLSWGCGWLKDLILARCKQRATAAHIAGCNMPMPHLLLDGDYVAVQPCQHHLLLAKAHAQHLQVTTSTP
jgi:hypothetical protein